MQRIEEVSDAQLVTSIARWSEVALAEVYRRHAGAVFGLAKRVLNSAAEAEDVAQEVFLRLWNQPERYDPLRGSLRSFLLAQAHGRAVDQVRSTSSRRQREARDALKAAEAGYDLQHEVWDLAVADQVARAMDGLPEAERRAIELAYFEGCTYREVAQLLGQPEGTVKSRIRNGMRRMRGALTGICQTRPGRRHRVWPAVHLHRGQDAWNGGGGSDSIADLRRFGGENVLAGAVIFCHPFLCKDDL